MKKVFHKRYNQPLTKNQDESISLTSAGIYCIEITASTKSWWQNIVNKRSFLKKDSLTFLLNKELLIPRKKKLLADDLWNGNVLKGNNQTSHSFVFLQASTHLISFVSHGSPLLYEMNVYLVEHQMVELKNIKSEKRDCIPWLVFLTHHGLAFTSLSMSARAGKDKNDDDDLQLRMNGEVVKNEDIKAHKEWYWCGKVLRGSEKKFQKEFRENELLSRIDISVDGTPTIDDMVVTIKKSPHIFTKEHVQRYSYKGMNKKEDYNRFDHEIVMAVNQWNAYFNDEYPPPEPLHPNLVKAMMYVESKMGYFPSSGYPSFPDVMQVADVNNPAIHTLNNDSWIDPTTKKVARESEWKDGKIAIIDYKGKVSSSSSQESILWATRWLYHKAQGITHEGIRYWKPWKEAVMLYNGDGNKKYVMEVYDVYNRGIDQKSKKYPIKLFSFLLFFLGAVTFSVYGASGVFHRVEKISPREEFVNKIYSKDILNGDNAQQVRHIMKDKIAIYERQDRYYYGDLFQDALTLCQQHKDECFGEYIFPSYLREILAKSKKIENFMAVMRELDVINAYNSSLGDFDNDGTNELLIILNDPLNHNYLEVLVVDPSDNTLRLAQTLIDRPYSGGPPRVVDVTGDAVAELVVFSSGGRQDTQAFIFQYANNELRKLLEITNAHTNVDFLFADQNKNGIPDIKVKGVRVDTCIGCVPVTIEEVFEYDKKQKKFNTLIYKENK